MKVLFITSTMDGGVGRVINLLSDELNKNGQQTDIHIIEPNTREKRSIGSVLLMMLAGFYSRILKMSEKAAILKFRSRNYNRIKKLRDSLNEKNADVLIAFLNEPIFMTLLSASKKHKVIISERNDPKKFAETKTTMSFVHILYQNAEIMVCQSPDAQSWYAGNSSVKTTVIFNPIKPDLPEIFNGERQKKIVNFCRISNQKNLIMLVDAFSMLSNAYPEYELYIYGDATGNGADGYKEEVEAHINEKGLSDKAFILSGRNDIHEKIKDYAMFVSSSDFEGMSNSMLEAMAMGMPVVCTDCPAGGARAVIKDHVNGILTPVGDAEAMYRAMKEIIDNPKLASMLSENAVKVRQEQSVEKITEKWMELING